MGDRLTAVARSYTIRLKVREAVLSPPLGVGGGVSLKGLRPVKKYPATCLGKV